MEIKPIDLDQFKKVINYIEQFLFSIVKLPSYEIYEISINLRTF